jgi:hypothetical protein
MWFLLLPGLLLAAAAATKPPPVGVRLLAGRTYRFVVTVEALDGKPVVSADLLKYFELLHAFDVLIMAGPPITAMFSAKNYVDHDVAKSLQPEIAGRVVRLTFVEVTELDGPQV